MLALDGDRVVAVLMSTRYPAGERSIRNVRIIVHPDARRRGIGGRLADVVDGQDPDGGATVRSECLASWSVGQALLEARGFRSVRTEFTMVRSLGGVSPAPVSGVTVRVAGPEDDADWVRLTEEGYSDGPDHTPLTQTDLALFRSEAGFRLWIAEQDGVAIGKCHVRPFGGSELWINSVVVGRLHRGRGIGRLLMCHALGALSADGVETVRLCVRAENAPAVALYRSLGFEVEETETVWWRDPPPT